MIFLLARCHPFEMNWALVANTSDNCASLDDFLIGIAVFGLIFDLVIWSIPIPMIFQLQLPLAQRLAICGIFAAGILCVVRDTF